MAHRLKVEIEIPDHVNWIAVDANGKVYGYITEPTHNTARPWWVSDGSGYMLLYNGPAPKNWKTELYTWE